MPLLYSNRTSIIYKKNLCWRSWTLRKSQQIYNKQVSYHKMEIIILFPTKRFMPISNFPWLITFCNQNYIHSFLPLFDVYWLFSLQPPWLGLMSKILNLTTINIHNRTYLIDKFFPKAKPFQFFDSGGYWKKQMAKVGNFALRKRGRKRRCKNFSKRNQSSQVNLKLYFGVSQFILFL